MIKRIKLSYRNYKCRRIIECWYKRRVRESKEQKSWGSDIPYNWKNVSDYGKQQIWVNWCRKQRIMNPPDPCIFYEIIDMQSRYYSKHELILFKNIL